MKEEKKMGRPRLSEDKKTQPVQLKFNVKEYNFLASEAEKVNSTVPGIIRDMVRNVIYEAPSVPMEDSILVHVRGKQRRISRQEARDLAAEIINKI